MVTHASQPNPVYFSVFPLSFCALALYWWGFVHTNIAYVIIDYNVIVFPAEGAQHADVSLQTLLEATHGIVIVCVWSSTPEMRLML